MSVQAMAWVFDYSEATKGERLVLLALANHLNGETGLCCPGIDLLASEVRLSHSATWRAIQRLEEGGHVEVVRSAGRGNRYRILGYDQARNAPTYQARSTAQPGALDPQTRRAHAPLTSNQKQPSRSASFERGSEDARREAQRRIDAENEARERTYRETEKSPPPPDLRAGLGR